MADKKDKSSDPANPFTFNAEKTGQMDIPSVSKLIDRKKLSDIKKVDKKLEAQNPSSQAFPTLNAVLETDSNTQIFSSKDISIQLDAPEVAAVLESSSKPAASEPPQANTGGIVLENFQGDSSSSASSEPAVSLQVEAPIELNTFSTTSQDSSPATSFTPAPTPVQEPEVDETPGIIIKSRKATFNLPVLSIWKKNALLTAKDPVAQFLKNTLANDLITGALFLAIEVSEANKTPVFRAKAALEGCEAWMGIWTGLEWNPKLIPEVWNFFVKNGFVEFSPPGTMTQLTSSRNVIRGAFGLGKTGYLTLVRVGSAQACRGVLALMSDNSITMAIDPFMSIAKS